MKPTILIPPSSPTQAAITMKTSYRILKMLLQVPCDLLRRRFPMIEIFSYVDDITLKMVATTRLLNEQLEQAIPPFSGS